MSAQSPFTQAFPTPTACFSVSATADPGVMLRVLEVFAKRGLVPSRCYSTVVGPAGAGIHIDLQVLGIDVGLRERIAETLRQVPTVETVLTSEKRAAMTA